MITAKSAKSAKFAKKNSRILFAFFAAFASFAVYTSAGASQLPRARLSFEAASVKRSPDPRSVTVFGPGLSKPSIDCDAYRAAKEKGAPLPVDPQRRPFGDRMPCVSTVMPVFDQTRVIPGAELRITAGGATIASIIPILSRELDRPLVDATGLTQLFDIELQYSLGVPRPDAEPGPPLRSALTDQLGLRVQDSVTVVDVLVIDRIDRPTPD